MKLNFIIAVVSVLLCSSIASASGSHAGGHGVPDTIGRPGKPENVTRTITVDMSDAMRFTPAAITVEQGETIKFTVRNSGRIAHEMVLGTEQELKAHYELMKKNPEMEHAEENMVTVQPGHAGEIIWQFTKAGMIDFACLLPGHYEAGMKGAVRVNPSSGSAEMTEGVVRKVDKANNKITIKHGEIKNLEMPGMTMVFQVRDPLLLDKVIAGAMVKFRAEKSGTVFVITDIQTNK